MEEDLGDLVLVTLPGPRKGEPIALVEALEDSLAMPEEGDTVRTLVARTARGRLRRRRCGALCFWPRGRAPSSRTSPG
jgi:hypothetical protein